MPRARIINALIRRRQFRAGLEDEIEAERTHIHRDARSCSIALRQVLSLSPRSGSARPPRLIGKHPGTEDAVA